MMNNVMKWALGLVGAVLLVLVMTCPNEEITRNGFPRNTA